MSKYRFDILCRWSFVFVFVLVASGLAKPVQDAAQSQPSSAAAASVAPVSSNNTTTIRHRNRHSDNFPGNLVRRSTEPDRRIGRLYTRHKTCLQLDKTEKRLITGDCTPNPQNRIKIIPSKKVGNLIVVLIAFVHTNHYVCVKNQTAYVMKAYSTDCLFIEEATESDRSYFYSYAYFHRNSKLNSNRLFLVATKTGRVRARVIPSEKAKGKLNIEFLLIPGETNYSPPSLTWGTNRFTTTTPSVQLSGGNKVTTVTPKREPSKTKPTCPPDKQKPGKVDILGFLHPCRVEANKPTLPTQTNQPNAKQPDKIRHHRKHKQDRADTQKIPDKSKDVQR